MYINQEFIQEVGLGTWLWKTAVRQFYKRILRLDHKMRLPTGEYFLLPRGSKFASEAFITGGNVDWGSEALLYAILPERGCLLDVGANIGYYSIYMIPSCSKIFAFEPDPRMLEGLSRNTINYPEITIIDKAIGRKSCVASFVLEDSGEVSHLARCDSASGNTIDVACTTIDDFVVERNLTSVSAIKIDIEGFDIDAIAGAQTVLEKMRPIILTEASPTQELFELLSPPDYLVMAYARDSTNRRISFLPIKADGVDGFETKMLFLVPRERVEELKATASTLNL